MDGYFNYLLEIINIEGADDYLPLLDILYRTDFRWSIHNDDNRALDGIEIRYNYQRDCEVNEDEFLELLNVPCSVIEVVCGLAIRMDEVMRDPEGAHINKWFWEMLNNLGLLKFSEKEFKKGAWTVEDVLGKLDIFMDRTYDELGHGGLFPRNECYKNQKEIELYSQMNGYLNEFYC